MASPPSDPLAFYRTPAPMTAIDLSDHGEAVAGLGRDVLALAETVRGVLVHRD
jgi:hypothetical protein